MAIINTTTFDQYGVATPFDLYININNVTVRQRNNTFVFHAILNVYANQQAKVDEKNPIKTESITGIYDVATTNNLHTFVYNFVKLLPGFENAVDA